MEKKIILGPPGCGKTTRLLSIMEQEMDKGVSPNEICFVTFTRKGASEAAERAAQKFSLKSSELPYFRTLHSMAYRLMGYGKDSVMGRQDWCELGRMLGVQFSTYYETEEGLPQGSEKGDKLRFIDGFARARLLTCDDAWRAVGDEDVSAAEVVQFSDTLEKYKDDMALVDYTGMLERFVIDGGPIPVKVAFIDEAQDLSTLQWEMVWRLVANAERVYIAGDDDQSIYRWAGADVDKFLALKDECQSVEVLGHSYRLPRMVYNMANTITGRIKRRYDKEWQPRDEDGAVHHIHDIADIDLSQGTWLLLARNVYLLDQFKRLARSQGVAYAVKGVPQVKQKHARAIVLWERLRRGESLTVDEVRTVYACMRLGTGVKRGFKGMTKASDAETYDMPRLRADFGLLRDDAWYDALQDIPAGDRTYYQSILRAGDNLLGQPRVNISTIHGVKGGEADNVVLLPDMAWRTYRDYQQEPDDEHRVFYVAVTRARHALYIAAPGSRWAYDI